MPSVLYREVPAQHFSLHLSSHNLTHLVLPKTHLHYCFIIPQLFTQFYFNGFCYVLLNFSLQQHIFMWFIWFKVVKCISKNYLRSVIKLLILSGRDTLMLISR